jgi:hypothetical protein
MKSLYESGPWSGLTDARCQRSLLQVWHGIVDLFDTSTLQIILSNRSSTLDIASPLAFPPILLAVSTNLAALSMAV